MNLNELKDYLYQQDIEMNYNHFNDSNDIVVLIDYPININEFDLCQLIKSNLINYKLDTIEHLDLVNNEDNNILSVMYYFKKL